MLHTGMTLEQAISLEPVFAKMQPDGQWKLPVWLEELQRLVAGDERLDRDRCLLVSIDYRSTF